MAEEVKKPIKEKTSQKEITNICKDIQVINASIDNIAFDINHIIDELNEIQNRVLKTESRLGID